jgi:hypothetical protein
MPVNTEINASIVFPTPVPPDQDCPPATLNEWLQAAADHLAISSRDPESPESQGDSIAELALNTANNALAQVTSLQGQIPARRTSGSTLFPLAAGDNSYALSWSPAMPNVNYAVHITVHGPVAATTSPLVPFVVSGSRTVDGVQVRFANVPAGAWSFSYEVVAL